ncbi:MAG: Holliday junction resolvase RuvX [Fimbriimonadaceae bacterium]|nr:Holliday junction resolvase RuvX [Fimbriimonadaceae bacterium]
MAVILALDVGQQTIGLAVCDDDGLPRALYTITRLNRRRDVAAVVAEGEQRRVTQLVVGLARTADGGEGESARRARRIGDLVAAACGLPVAYQDEYLSSFEAEDRLRARGFRGEPLRQRLDAEAARVILEGYLARPDDQA